MKKEIQSRDYDSFTETSDSESDVEEQFDITPKKKSVTNKKKQQAPSSSSKTSSKKKQEDKDVYTQGIMALLNEYNQARKRTEAEELLSTLETDPLMSFSNSVR